MMDAELSGQDDKFLVRLVKDGDEAAFESLFKKYSKRLFYFAFHILNSKEEAEGLVQDVFVKIWEDRDKLNPDFSFSGYIFTIAKNATSNLFRKNVNREVYKLFLKRNPSTNTSKTEDDISFNELQTALVDLINNLPPKRKMISELSLNGGLSRGEIAERLGIKVGTVDNQLIKARQFIREGLFSIYYSNS